MATSEVATIGAVIASVLGMPTVLGTKELWSYLYVVDILLLIPVVLILICLPESPG